jgi:hypothetical protein
VIVLVAIVVVAGVGLKAAGYDLPLIDYPIGPFGEPLVRPQIEIHPPGYDVPMP